MDVVADVEDPEAPARAAHLRYVSSDQPGIRRRRRGSGFGYVDSEGNTLTDRADLDRIRSPTIPPAPEEGAVLRLLRTPEQS